LSLTWAGTVLLGAGKSGIQHIAFRVDPEHIEEEVEELKAEGLEIVASGEWDGGTFYYFDTRKAGGFVTELVSHWK